MNSFYFVSPRVPTHYRRRILLLHLITNMDTHAHKHRRTPLEEGSVRRRFLCLQNTQHAQETNIHAPGGIRTSNPSERLQTDALDRAATVTGIMNSCYICEGIDCSPLYIFRSYCIESTRHNMITVCIEIGFCVVGLPYRKQL